MTRKSDLAAGVKKRMLRSRSRKSGRDVGAVEDVLQVVGRAALPLERLLELAVEGGELLVERLQLLLRGGQLLVGRQELLVDGQSLFVDRLLLLVGDLEIADGALQLLAGGVELMLQLFDPRDFGRSVGAADRTDLCSLLASSRKLTSSNSSPSLCTGWTAMLTETVLAPSFTCAAGDDDALALLARLLDRRPELVAQAVARHGKQVPARLARGHPQIAVRRAQVIEALVFAVDQHRGRRIGLQQQPLGEIAEAGPARRCRLHARDPERSARRRRAAMEKLTSPGRRRPTWR